MWYRSCEQILSKLKSLLWQITKNLNFPNSIKQSWLKIIKIASKLLFSVTQEARMWFYQELKAHPWELDSIHLNPNCPFMMSDWVTVSVPAPLWWVIEWLYQYLPPYDEWLSDCISTCPFIMSDWVTVSLPAPLWWVIEGLYQDLPPYDEWFNDCMPTCPLMISPEVHNTVSPGGVSTLVGPPHLPVYSLQFTVNTLLYTVYSVQCTSWVRPSIRCLVYLQCIVRVVHNYK